VKANSEVGQVFKLRSNIYRIIRHYRWKWSMGRIS